MNPVIQRAALEVLNDWNREAAGSRSSAAAQWTTRRDEAKRDFEFSSTQVEKFEQTVAEIERALAEDPEEEGSTDGR